ncbi:MAG: acetolactate synthase small subunit [Gammaproteobacteria bacterium]|nr:MAG: acetolactate synthase small subunit [Gammaproteobacteria bacterium]
MRHIISILLENEAGALSRVSGLFSARGYNIESLTVAPTDDSTVSRITVITEGSDKVISQIVNQLNKLVDVVKVLDLTADEHIEREVLLLKLHDNDVAKAVIEILTSEYKGRVVSDSKDAIVVEITGVGEKLDRAIQAVPSEIVFELVRSGALGIAAGKQILKLESMR